jgi:hypothetical protein
VDIEQHMNRCAGCGHTAECDDQLAGGKVDAARIGFCENEQSLQEIVEKENAATASER